MSGQTRYGLTSEMHEKVRAATVIPDEPKATWPRGITDDDVVRMVVGEREVSAGVRAAILERMRNWRERPQRKESAKVGDEMTFEEALKQHNSDAIDDLAHGRQSRYPEPDGCFGRGYRIESPRPSFRWPEPWTVPFCMDCARPFMDREPLHPERVQPVIGYDDEMIVARCAGCFARYLEAAGRRIASAFGRQVASIEESRRCVDIMAAALESLGDPAAVFAKMRDDDWGPDIDTSA